MELPQIKKEVEFAMMDLIRKFPFYGHIIVQMSKQFVDSGVSTLGVGKKETDLMIKLFINKKYISKTFEENTIEVASNHLIEVIKHEVLHLVFEHLNIQQNRSIKEKKIFDMACECEVNSYVSRDNLIDNPDGTPGGVFPEDFEFKEKLSVYKYYDLLLKRDEEKNSGDESDGDGSGEDGSGEDDSEGKMLDSHDLWESIKDDPIAQDIVKDMIRKSAETCKETGQWGDLPNNIQEQVEDSLKIKKPKIPWQRVMRLFAAANSESEIQITMKRRSKRFGTRPGIRKDDILNVAIIVDTSASIDNEQLKIFFNEVYWMSKNNCNITIIECDTQVQRVYKFKKWDGTVLSRGGTDLSDGVQKAAELKSDCAICFSDMDMSKIHERYNMPVLWVCSNSYSWNEGDEPPYPGKVICID